MTDRQELINAIEKECQKANPDLLKLEFGCKVSFPDEFDHLKWHDGTVLDVWEMKWMRIFSPKFSTYNELVIRPLEDQRIRIFGKEPQLFDVGMAIIENTNHGLRDDVDNKILKQFGLWFETIYPWTIGDLLFYFWELGGLYNQNPETLRFIYSLLFAK